jgi:hypothetical protein
VKSIRDISKGEELFANYEFTFLRSPFWFKKSLVQFLHQNPGNENGIIPFSNGLTLEKMEEIILKIEKKI